MTLNLGLEAMFSDRVEEALGSAVNVAQHYVTSMHAASSATPMRSPTIVQHRPQPVRRRQACEARRLLRQAQFADQGPRTAGLLHHGRPRANIASTKQQFLKDPKPPSAADLAQARARLDRGGCPALDGTVTALIQLQALNDAYLMVVRLVDPASVRLLPPHRLCRVGI